MTNSEFAITLWSILCVMQRHSVILGARDDKRWGNRGQSLGQAASNPLPPSFPMVRHWQRGADVNRCTTRMGKIVIPL